MLRNLISSFFMLHFLKFWVVNPNLEQIWTKLKSFMVGCIAILFTQMTIATRFPGDQGRCYCLLRYGEGTRASCFTSILKPCGNNNWFMERTKDAQELLEAQPSASLVSWLVKNWQVNSWMKTNFTSWMNTKISFVREKRRCSLIGLFNSIFLLTSSSCIRGKLKRAQLN